jgi:hypothetical protein
VKFVVCLSCSQSRTTNFASGQAPPSVDSYT